MAATLEIFEAQLVLVGNFAPATFSPHWFHRMELIGEDDVAAAEEESESQEDGVPLLVGSQGTQFGTDWFTLHAAPEQLFFRSRGAVTPALRDLVVGMLTILPESVISAIGINFTAHYRPRTEAETHKFGDTVVPKTIWHDLFPGRHVGLSNLQLAAEDPPKKGERSGERDLERFYVQPSVKIPHGLFLAVNFHRKVAEDAKRRSQGAIAASIIRDGWDEYWTRAIKMFDTVMEKTIGSGQ
ncbi:hypothetical protein [Burkholderia sola]